MKKYYLVMNESIITKGHYDIFISDHPKAGQVLFEFNAKNYDEANRMFTFTLSTPAKRCWFRYDDVETLDRIRAEKSAAVSAQLGLE